MADDRELEWAHTILEPHFDAVRDQFAAFVPKGATHALTRLSRVRYVMQHDVHDTERHFAGTRTDGRLMVFAPQIVELPFQGAVAVIAHEFGHAADMAYPGAWTWPFDKAGLSYWVGESPAERAIAWRALFGSSRARSRTPHDDADPAVNWAKAWADRTDDQVEWAADGICEAVTGTRPLYGGKCLIQCFTSGCGVERPAGLR